MFGTNHGPRATYVLSLLVGVALGDAYANNQNPIVVDSPQVAANFPDIEGIEILAPAFLNPETIPSTWLNGTSGPTPQSTLESFVRSLAAQHTWIKYHDNLISEEGRAIPYVTLSNGKNTDKKLRIWIQGGQHGDEPAGDQGVLALLGKLAHDTNWTSNVLDKIDLAILPRYNVDGVEYFQRQLASNYDPNRDHAVLLRDQTRAIRQAQADFDPHIYVDNHEYTGVNPVAQRYIRAQDLLVSGNKNPNLTPSIRLLNEHFVTDIFTAARTKGLRTGPYFTTSVANATITVQEPDWHAQANHKAAGNFQALTFLVETRGIRLGTQHFQRRVAAHLLSLETIIEKAVGEFESVYAAISAGRDAFVQSGAEIVVRDDYAVVRKEVAFLDKDTGNLVNVSVLSQNYDSPTPVLVTRPRPKAYVFPPSYAHLAHNLRTHGVNVTTLDTPFSGTVEALNVTSATLSTTKFEGIVGTAIRTSPMRRVLKIPKGAFWVDARQVRAGFAFAVLEPEGRGSAGWYNTVSVEEGDEWPVFRVV